MEPIWEELTRGFSSSTHFGFICVRLIVAILLGAVIGYEREVAGKSAGLRTHILVTLGTCLFVVSATNSGLSPEGVSRVMQGVLAGVGFLGAGSIMKADGSNHVSGLTSAAGIWMTAAIGVAVGLGMIGLAVLGAILAWFVLSFVARFEPNIHRRAASRQSGEVDGS